MVQRGPVSSHVSRMIRFAKGGEPKFSVFENANQVTLDSLEIIQILNFDITIVSVTQN